jgi:uncharacterized GH25 family protein
MSRASLWRRCDRRSVSLAAGLLIATTVRLAAHDFWIQPSAFRPRIGALVGLQLLVGQDMIGDPVPRDPAAVKEFVVASGSHQKAVPGRDGGNPAGIIRVEAPSLLVVGYQSYPRSIDLAPDKFDQYLGEEGLDAIRSLAIASKKSDRPAHERYSRCAKSLLLSGAPAKTDGDRTLGLTLELVAERNPYLTPPGQPLPFELTYEGKPQTGALVIAVNERDPSRKMSARSDRAGRVVFTFPVGGAWLVKAVHMIPSKSPDADWESFWASLTFELSDANERRSSR